MSKKAKVIAIDSGKAQTKIAFEEFDVNLGEEVIKHYKFDTKIKETEEVSTRDSQSLVLELEGERVLLGRQGEKFDFSDSKKQDIHKKAIYASIAKYVNDGDVIEKLSIGAPLSVFQNKKEREQYKAFIKGDGHVNLKINNVNKSFHIEKVIVCPESSGIIYKNAQKFKDRVVAVVDIGGLNTNCAVYKELLPVNTFTNKLGVNILKNELKYELNQAFVKSQIQDYQMDQIIETGYIKSDVEKSKKIISEFIKRHIQAVIEEAKKKGWDIENLDFYFVGGGSKKFQREILEIIPDAIISENAEWDNVDGFLQIAKRR